MTFIIKQITKRLGGQDLVRERTVEAQELSVGRKAGSDIYLTDLRIALDHLLISIRQGNVVVKALSDRTFSLDGKAVKTATLSAGRRYHIEVGPYALRFEQKSEQRAWSIAVERVEPEDVLDDEQVDDIFSLRGSRWGKRAPSVFSLALVLALFLILPIAAFSGLIPQPEVIEEEGAGGAIRTTLEEPSTFIERVSFNVDADGAWLSGPLSKAHARYEDQCDVCHATAFEHVTDASCIECHDDLYNHAEPPRLATSLSPPEGGEIILAAAGSFFGKEEGECASCHREHNGDAGIILNNSSLCTDCHTGMAGRLTDTDLEDVGDFGRAHPNFHAQVTQTPGDAPVFARYSLDDPKLADNSGLKFPHDVHLRETGAVANQAQQLAAAGRHNFGDALVCADCHTLDSAGLLFEKVEMEPHCQMCHSLTFDTDGAVARKLPHGEPQEVIAVMRDFYRGQTIQAATEPSASTATRRRRPGGVSADRQVVRAQEALVNVESIADTFVARIFSPGGACHDCHEVIPAPPGTVDFDILPVVLVDNFMTKTVFNHDQHDISELSCESCHAARGSDAASHVLLPSIDTKVSALTGEEVIGCRDCHGGEKARGDLLPSPCTDCHGYHDAEHAPLMTAESAASHPPIITGAVDFQPARWGRIHEAADLD